MKMTQVATAKAAGIDLATLKGLEAGGGTVGPLIRVLAALGHRFADQPLDLNLGAWIAKTRKGAGLTQSAIATSLRISKPTVIGLEHGRGSVAILLGIMKAIRLRPELVHRDHGAVRLFLGDCLRVMPTLPSGGVDAIIADLPYSITPLAWDRSIDLDKWWAEVRRLLKPTGAVILTASQPFTTELIESNREWFKYTIVWKKNRGTAHLLSKHRPIQMHEDIVVFSPGVIVTTNRSSRQMTYNPQHLITLDRSEKRKGGPIKSRYLVRSKVGSPTTQTHTNYPTSILEFDVEPKAHHPTQKPLELMRYLVRTYSNPGDVILDCCIGSGTTCVAAVEEGRHSIGIERDPGYFAHAKERIAIIADGGAKAR